MLPAEPPQMRRALWLWPIVAIFPIAAAADSSLQTFAAFKTTVSYRFDCAHDVFAIGLEAVNQVPSGGESTLYWEIWDSGQIPLGGVQNVATLNTLQVQAALNTPTDHDSAVGVVTKVYRSCAGQSLYVWPASSATRLPNGDVDVRFADAVEEPLSQQ